MYTIELGQIAKRKNSTFVPADAAFTLQVQATLKEPTSDNQPVFLLSISDNLFPYNYLKWGNWYYWITDIKRVRNGLFEVTCDLDVLATYKTNILATTAFVLYDQTANTEIVDSRLSVKTSSTISVADGTSSMFEAGATCLVGIVGKNGTGIYAMSTSQLADLMSSITNWLDDPDFLEVPEISDFSTIDDAAGVLIHNITVGFRQLIATGKAPDCIKSALVVPVDASRFPGTVTAVCLGDYETGIQAKLLTATARATETFTIPIPWQSTDWRRNAPYHSVYVYLPYAGVVSLPASELIGAASLTVNLTVTQNGSVVYSVNVRGGVLFKTGGNCASNLLVGASNINPLSAFGGIAVGAGAAAGVAAAATPLGAVAAGAAGLVGMFNSIAPIPSSIGGGGGGAFTSGYIPQCATIFHDTNVAPDSIAATMGTPTFAQKLLSTLSGFVQTRNVSVSAPAEGPILDRINGLLDGGVYIE